MRQLYEAIELLCLQTQPKRKTIIEHVIISYLYSSIKVFA